ncbi:M24 family metallopeptidase [Geopsychrobacter electrodiphilus]|uniref:M24 family metallopeptidase n=1 Tax=Geopsychrobacter electrodiphilus TaxID=225196 RepID=UPI000A038887|nr:Xaa-Pro peptidase family protein [Geopsychrobacter electrodiphilus]
MTAASSTFCKRVVTECALDALVFFDLKNIRYCCGFSGTDGLYVYHPSGDWFLTDSRYQEQASNEVIASGQSCYQNKIDGLIDLLLGAGYHKVGFEADSVSVSRLNDLTQRSSQLEWVPVAEQLRPLRGVKSDSEVNLLQRAADLNAVAFSEIESLIRPGITELHIAQELEFSLRRLGGEDRAFEFIVASGPRGAMPHGVATDRVLEIGDMVTIDFGTRVGGYHSDETVTVGLGQVDKDLRHIFDVVLEAHDLAMGEAKPGVVLADLDAVARRHIEAVGFGGYFGHGLGHGVGLDIHEYPTVSNKGLDKLQPGMVITIEPGIYMPGRGGVRVEDTILITEDGYRALTSIPKKFRALT